MATTHEEAPNSIVAVALVCGAVDIGRRGARYGFYAPAVGYWSDCCSLNMKRFLQSRAVVRPLTDDMLSEGTLCGASGHALRPSPRQSRLPRSPEDRWMVGMLHQGAIVGAL